MPGDLHNHTTCSDGSTPIQRLAPMAARAGLDVLAISDHDTLLNYCCTRRALEFAPRRAYQALTCKRPFVGVSPVRVHAGRKRQDQLHTFRPLSCNQWVARSLAFSSPASSARIIPTASLSSSFTAV